MQPLIYDVAVSADGFICGPDEDISRFPHEGPEVDAYLNRLQGYAVAVMGRATYEFGYRFGLAPGANPYAHMETLVFSKSLDLPDGAAVHLERGDATDRVRDLKEEAAGPVYLCGGGAFAASLLDAGLINRLRLKRAPIVLGSGRPLFGGARTASDLRLDEMRADPVTGFVYQDFAVLADPENAGKAPSSG